MTRLSFMVNDRIYACFSRIGPHTALNGDGHSFRRTAAGSILDLGLDLPLSVWEGLDQQSRSIMIMIPLPRQPKEISEQQHIPSLQFINDDFRLFDPPLIAGITIRCQIL